MGSIFTSLASLPEPTQARSREALDRFLAAGERLLAENRFEEAGIAELANEAQSSVGTFYRLLSEKETLTLLLMQRFFTEIEDMVETTFHPDRWQGQGIAAIAETFVEVFVDIYEGRGGALRALILRASRDASFRDQVHQLNQLIGKRLGSLLRQRKDEITHPRPEQAIKAVAHMVLGILNQHTITGSLGGLSRKNLNAELVRVFNQYLGVST
ncbi:TetR/AcrR family transcriptional regulator [Aestuariicella hydrocarbonica]|uniref:TetR/AcrR family transcriptional regulator n=1 Tax=Pseudomaricurvus hydrocarbonicus TaxID=1470433 RepID=A0A9E5JRU4_9GAMM|nr:TetR family transcriptional regulator [Aestuariicella hydrocarbonica]NHO65568.1 TetR/AcrR family transcriptional regulator [Aestuariicella hydrocarbonica]